MFVDGQQSRYPGCLTSSERKRQARRGRTAKDYVYTGTGSLSSSLRLLVLGDIHGGQALESSSCYKRRMRRINSIA
jgi:hypothetical protein